MEEKKLNRKTRATLFSKWFLNNKVVTILLISLLVFLNLLVFSKITYIFNPIKEFFSVVGLPIILTGLLFYLVNPLISQMEKRNIPRIVSIGIVFVIIIGLIAWGIFILTPIVREQALNLITTWPIYWHTLSFKFNNLLQSDMLAQLEVQLADLSSNLIKSFSEQTDGVMESTFSRIGSLVGTVTNLVIAIFTMPILLFFLLKDGQALPHHFMKFFPTKMRLPLYNLLIEINTKISQYIRGQVLVAFFVGLMFWIGFAIVGLEYAVLFAILAGILNLVPYLGSFLAMIPIIIVALFTSPFMLVKVLIVFSIEQVLEGRLIQPLILGTNLKIHPVTIIIVLLTAGKLFGVVGVILGVPAYAVLKVIFQHLFAWYKAYSGLYTDDYNPAPEPSSPIAKKKKKRG